MEHPFRSLRAPRVAVKDAGFVIATFVVLLITHAIAYLTHEYSHSLAAWSLGWMDHPFGIVYGPTTLNNILFLGDVDDNVHYAPIMASGHGWAASIIALSGPFVGNGALYFVLYALARTDRLRTNRYLCTFIYWLALMCAANVWSYVPLRAITTHADIALAAQGLGISTLALFPIVMIPAGYIVFHFFCRMFPLCQSAMTADSPGRSIVIACLTSFWFFSYFAGDGVGGAYGPVSQVLCITSRFVLLPISMWLMAERAPSGDSQRG